MKPRVCPVVLHVVLPVAVGAALYTAFRERGLLVFGWYEQAGLGGAVEAVRSFTMPAAPFLPRPLIYSLPDGLWVYALTALMARLWSGERGFYRTFWLSTGLLCGPVAELLQIPRWVPGTFDPADFVITAAAFAAALFNARADRGARATEPQPC
jgi:hypothetical protein